MPSPNVTLPVLRTHRGTREQQAQVPAAIGAQRRAPPRAVHAGGGNARLSRRSRARRAWDAAPTHALPGPAHSIERHASRPLARPRGPGHARLPTCCISAPAAPVPGTAGSTCRPPPPPQRPAPGRPPPPLPPTPSASSAPAGGARRPAQDHTQGQGWCRYTIPLPASGSSGLQGPAPTCAMPSSASACTSRAVHAVNKGGACPAAAVPAASPPSAAAAAAAASALCWYSSAAVALSAQAAAQCAAARHAAARGMPCSCSALRAQLACSWPVRVAAGASPSACCMSSRGVVCCAGVLLSAAARRVQRAAACPSSPPASSALACSRVAVSCSSEVRAGGVPLVAGSAAAAAAACPAWLAASACEAGPGAGSSQWAGTRRAAGGAGRWRAGAAQAPRAVWLDTRTRPAGAPTHWCWRPCTSDAATCSLLGMPTQGVRCSPPHPTSASAGQPGQPARHAGSGRVGYAQHVQRGQLTWLHPGGQRSWPGPTAGCRSPVHHPHPAT